LGCSCALELELEELGLDGLGLAALGLELELEPDAALPDVLGELAPPLAWSFFDMDAEPEAEPDGEDGEVEDGEVVEPADDEAEPDGDEVAPRGAFGSPARSQAVTRAVPRATETASARVLNLM
jgi:hypothetical protein